MRTPRRTAAQAPTPTSEATGSGSTRRTDGHPVRRVAIAAGTVVLTLAVILALLVGRDPNAAKARSELLGEAAPSFDLPTLGGGRVTSGSLAGRAVIVNFWNTWCIPCREEHPALTRFYARHASDPDFAMVGIVRDDTKSAVRRYVREESVPWTVAFDPGAGAALNFGTRGQPETFAISPNGIIVASHYGPSTVADLEEMLDVARGSP